MNIFKYRILNHILFWILIYAFYTLPFILTSGNISEASINLLYIPFDILTVYFVIEFLIPRYLLKNRQIFIFFIGIVAAISANILISQYIKYNIQPLVGFWVLKRPLTVDLFYALLTNFMIVGLASAMKLLRYSYYIQLKQSEMERRTVQSELNILRSQVNPHFLFNVLNNIDALIFEDKEKASTAIFLLSRIMRFMLKESVEEKVMLEKELNYIKDYVELAKLSFQDPKFIQLNISGNNSTKQIPPLLFIPIIENAVKHCNKQADLPGIIIDFAINSESVSLKTSNYVKRNDFKLPDSGTGTGLKNVEKRLKLLYKDNYTFDITRKSDKFDVDIKIPI
jgi:sensor histidine kinase YesM